MILQAVWFALWGALWAIYFTLDGFDLGVGMLRPFLARDETARRQSLAAIGPVWNGNEVWLVTAGGATFAAFPLVYASMFSFLYLPMLLILFSLIVRGVGVEFRSKVEGRRWRSAWDLAIAVSSLVAPLVLGLGFGNIFEGLPLAADGYKGSFWGLFNPYGLLTALLFIALFLEHGALWLAFRAAAPTAERSRRLAGPLWYPAAAAALLFVAASAAQPALAANYLARPLLLAVPLLALAALAAARLLLKRPPAAFAASSAAIFLLFASALVGLFPRLIPSSLDPAAGLTAYNASSGPYTLRLMTIVAAIFVPIVAAYQLLVYRFLGRRAVARSGQADEGGEGEY